MNETPDAGPAAKSDAQSDPLDDLPVAYVEMDAHGAITRASRMTRALHSCHAGQLIGKLAWELMPTEEQEQSCATFATAMETGEDPPVARRSIYTASGNFCVYELHRNVIRDAEGRSTGMRVVTVDVTDAQKALEEAERARVWLESVMASLSAAVIVTDALGFIRTLNPAAEKLLGWKAEELIGKVVERALPVLSYVFDGKKQPEFTMALNEGSRGIATMLDRESRELLVEIGSSPIVNRVSGNTEGVVSVLRRVGEE